MCNFFQITNIQPYLKSVAAYKYIKVVHTHLKQFFLALSLHYWSLLILFGGGGVWIEYLRIYIFVLSKIFVVNILVVLEKNLIKTHTVFIEFFWLDPIWKRYLYNLDSISHKNAFIQVYKLNVITKSLFSCIKRWKIRIF